MPRPVLLTFLIFFIVLLSPVSAEVVIELAGLQKELQPLIKKSVEPPPALQRSGPVNPVWFARYLKKLPQKIRENLEPYGYYHAEISVQQKTQEETVLLQVLVEPGPALRLVERRIGVVGDSPDRPEIPLDSFPLKIGGVLREDLYAKGKAELIAQVRDQGFLEARYLRHELQIDREKNQARILLEIAAGRRSRFGAVTFSGAEEFPERFLRRHLAFEEGEHFSYRLLGKTQKQLRDSDRFRKVLVVPKMEERQGARVPIGVELKPRKRYSLRPGVGFGTDTGARAVLRYRDANAWRLGHEFNIDLLLAQRVQNYTGSYSFPSYRSLNTGLNLSGGYRAEQLSSYDNRYIFAEVEQTYGFGGGRIGALFSRAQYEHTDISTDSVFTGFLMPGIRYTEVQLPESTGKSYGFHIQGEARFTDRYLFSDISLAQLLVNGDLLLPLPLRMSVSLRLQGATTILDNPFAEIPASLRFFAGGDRSVRGYAYQSLGPKDEDGEVIGGKHLVTGSFELAKRIGKNWGLAVFIDGGNAFDSWNDYQLAFGAGTGLRYATPIGPVQVDLASPVGEGEISLRLHVGIGFGW